MIVLNSEMFCESRYHGLVGGKPIFRDFAVDLCEFIQWQFTHSTKKKKLYDAKKYLYYYIFEYEDIDRWFKQHNKVFRYPVFLLERGSKVAIKVSVARMVKGRRNEHKTMSLIKYNGNMLASHSSKLISTDDGSCAKRHIIFINAYWVSKKENMSVTDYVNSDKFVENMCGTISHEMTHAFDSYKSARQSKDLNNIRISIRKKYKRKNNIGKEYTTLVPFGEWNGNSYTLDKDFLNKDFNIRTFLYTMLYYMSRSEMNAYLQTMYNQLKNLKSTNGFDSNAYQRYHTIKYVLRYLTDNVTKEVADRNVTNGLKRDFVRMYPKLKRIKEKGNEEVIKIIAETFLKVTEDYIYRMNKLLYDIKTNDGR